MLDSRRIAPRKRTSGITKGGPKKSRIQAAAQQNDTHEHDEHSLLDDPEKIVGTGELDDTQGHSGTPKK